MTAESAISKKADCLPLPDSLCMTAGSSLEPDAVIKEHLWLLIQIANYQSSLTLPQCLLATLAKPQVK